MLGWRDTGLAILAPLAGELGLEGEEETLLDLGLLSSMDLCSWLTLKEKSGGEVILVYLRGEELYEEREDWEMFEIVLLGVSLALGLSSVRLALLTGGSPPAPACTATSCLFTSSLRALINSSCRTPQLSLSSPMISVIFSISSCNSSCSAFLASTISLYWFLSSFRRLVEESSYL